MVEKNGVQSAQECSWLQLVLESGAFIQINIKTVNTHFRCICFALSDPPPGSSKVPVTLPLAFSMLEKVKVANSLGCLSAVTFHEDAKSRVD